VVGLRESCEKYLAQHLCSDSVYSIWSASHVLGLKKLGLKCKDVVLFKGKTVLERGDFIVLPKEFVIVVVKTTSWKQLERLCSRQ
jgi:hypothetical protein